MQPWLRGAAIGASTLCRQATVQSGCSVAMYLCAFVTLSLQSNAALTCSMMAIIMMNDASVNMLHMYRT